MVLAAVHDLAVVEQIVELPAIDLVERKMEAQFWVILKKVANVEGREEVEARVAPIGGPHHCEGLSTAGLPIRKASRLRALEGALNQRLHAYLVYLMRP